jgi:hypothetical protein
MIRYPGDLRHKPFGNSEAIKDADVLAVLDYINVGQSLQLQSNFCTSYLQWIKSTTLNTFVGLEQFTHTAYSNGTTESFDKFYLKNADKRFRCFKGEYKYHQLSWRDCFNWAFLEDDALQLGDAVVISLPFSDTGNEHVNMNQVLTECNVLDIPVLIDCAYFGICSNITFDVSHKCITDLTFSLSKTFPVAHARIGMRLTKIDNDDSLFVCDKAGYVNRIGCAIGQALISTFTPDYIVKTYKDKQFEICSLLDITPSNTVLFGLGGPEWNEYNRGCDTNRLGLHKYLTQNIEILKHDIQSKNS